VTGELREKLERGLALFDFDGTLIPWDTQVLFADFVLRREPVRRLYLPLFLACLPAAGILGDEGMKRVFLSYLWGVDKERLGGWTREFAATWVPGRCYPEVVEKLERHRAAGHLTVLASASPDFYVREVGRLLGFDVALGTAVEVGDRVGLFPDLSNHKGSAKVRRLSELLGPPGAGVWAGSHGYTDSSADLPMMRCCEGGTVVNPSPRLTLEAERRGWEVLRPPVPWKSRTDKAVRILRFIAGI
jgi:HAD superfamily hydrolase (TIGR01490 family)